MWWLMAAHHELAAMPAVRAPEPVVEPVVEPVKEPSRTPLACPKCGKTGRGLTIHIRNCKG